MSEHNEILLSRYGKGSRQFGVVTLNRVKALNALNYSMIVQLLEQLKAWEDDDSIGAVVVKSNSEKAFCAGGDIRQLYQNKEQGAHQDPPFFATEYALNRLIFHYSKPYIALMDGITMGGGLGISMHGSHRIATEKLQWAMPESKIGFFTDVGASYHLSRLPEMVGYYLALSGRTIDVATAQDLNLVDATVPSSNLAELEAALYALDLAHNADEMISEAISSFIKPMEVNALAEYYPKIRRCFSMNSIEGIFQALELEADDWSDALLGELRQRSPTSLKVIFNQLNRAINLSFDELISQDLVVAKHFLQGQDLFEGVRALLIEKDLTPHWNPVSLIKVQESDVVEYFNPQSASV